MAHDNDVAVIERHERGFRAYLDRYSSNPDSRTRWSDSVAAYWAEAARSSNQAA